MGEIERLRGEVVSLRGENDALRRQLGIEPRPPEPERDDEQRPIRVLVYPGPDDEERRGRPQGVAANLAQTMLRILRERRPGVEWRAEYGLERIPEDAACHQLGEVVRVMWDGSGVPATFVVERDESGKPRLCRRLVEGEPASEEFSAGLDRLFSSFDDLMAEATAALEAGAGHHAIWALKAMDVVRANINLAIVSFECGEERWREVLRKPRPEFETAVVGLEVGADAPIGQ